MKNEHILIIDDDILLLEQAENILEEKYAVSLANSGKKAINYLSGGGEADIILLDVMMPGMDGYKTLEEIRKIERCRDIPVIFLTGLTDTESELHCLNSGAADYITKPYDPRVLMARIERRLNTGYKFDMKKIEALPESLTENEWKIAELLAKSYSNEEIGSELNYAIDTVKKYVSGILRKMQIKNRREIKKYLR